MESRTLKRSLMAFALSATLWVANAGANTFYFQSEPQDPLTEAGPRRVLIVGPAGATGTVTGSASFGFASNFDLSDARWALITLPNDRMGEGVVEYKGFKVTSDATVSAYFLDQIDHSPDMAALIDAAKLGTDYVVAGYHQFWEDQISIQATQDNTAVTISPKAGPPTSFVLHAGQTYLFSDYGDFTGYRVSADKPIAVQSGNADNLVEQIPPIDALSTSYLLPLTRRVTDADLTGNVVRVVASADDTEVALNGVTVAILNKGDYYEGVLREAAQINTTHPALVVEYLDGSTGYLFGSEVFGAALGFGPSMAVIPGSDQWLTRYSFYALGDPFTSNQASIVIETAALPSLRLDGQNFDPGLFTPIPGTAYSYGTVTFPQPAQAYDVTADRPFELLPMGFGHNSYFTFAGSSFAHGTALPPPQVTPPARKPPTAGGDLSMAANMFFFQLQPSSGPVTTRQLMLMGPAGATGTVTGSSGFSQLFTLDAGGYALMDLPVDAVPTPSHVENKGFWIKSDAALTAKLIDAGDMVSLIGADKLGTEYQAVIQARFVLDLDNQRNHITVQAIEDHTTVTITPNTSSMGFNRVILDAGQTYDYSSSTPPFGSSQTVFTAISVAADKPVAVISGNACLNIDRRAYTCDHLAEQMPPVTAVQSSSYLLPEMPNSGPSGDPVWVVATEGNTVVTVNGMTVAPTLDKGAMWGGQVKGGANVVANHPVLVGELLDDPPVDSNSHRALTIVPGMENWLTHYDLAVSPGSDYASHYVTLVAKTDSLAGLRVAGAAVNPAAFNPIGLTGYSYGSVDVSDRSGTFTVTGDTPFELLQSGFGGGSSYFTYGANFPVNTSPPAPPAPPPPQCHGDSARVEAGSAVMIDVLANDTAPSGALRIVSVSSPIEGGTAILNDDGSVQYIPPPGYTGVDSFSYVVKDAAGGTSEAQVDVDVIVPGVTGPDPTPPAAGGGPASSDGAGSGASPAAASSGGGGTLRIHELLGLLGLSLLYAAGRMGRGKRGLQ